MTGPGPEEVRPIGDTQNLVYFNNVRVCLCVCMCCWVSVHRTWIIIMALLLHVRRVRAVSALQYRRFAYACVSPACVCVSALCVSDCACVRAFFRIVLNTKTQNSERISKKVRFFITINTYRLYI